VADKPYHRKLLTIIAGDVHVPSIISASFWQFFMGNDVYVGRILSLSFFWHQFLHSIFWARKPMIGKRIVCQSSSLDLPFMIGMAMKSGLSLLTLLAILSPVSFLRLYKVVGKRCGGRMAL